MFYDHVCVCVVMLTTSNETLMLRIKLNCYLKMRINKSTKVKFVASISELLPIHRGGQLHVPLGFLLSVFFFQSSHWKHTQTHTQTADEDTPKVLWDQNQVGSRTGLQTVPPWQPAIFCLISSASSGEKWNDFTGICLSVSASLEANPWRKTPWIQSSKMITSKERVQSFYR